jgi:hypothetical protein
MREVALMLKAIHAQESQQAAQAKAAAVVAELDGGSGGMASSHPAHINELRLDRSAYRPTVTDSEKAKDSGHSQTQQ